MIPPTPWVRSFCPLSLLYPSVSDFQFRYTPVTVGKGRAAWFSLRSASVLSFGRGDKAAESGDVDYEYHHIIKGLYTTCSSWHIDPCCFALNQRSPARNGIENRWPKGKAKVKGIGGSFFRPNCFVHWPNIHLWNRSQFCKLILFIETYCAIIRGMPSSYCQEDATSISLVSSHRSYFFN